MNCGKNCINKNSHNTMKFFKIIDYDFEEPQEERATIIVINDRRIYACDYRSDDFEEIRVDGAVLTIRMPNNGVVRSTNWTTIYDEEMDKSDIEYYKDFTRL